MSQQRFREGPSLSYVKPEASKKDTSKPLNAEFDPEQVESGWSEWWESQGFYFAEKNSTKPKYVIPTPPPNVTGVLHIGHALGVTVQDIISRCKRMQGFNVAWIPGTDHAGIATQSVVERHLRETQGKYRTDYKREDFLDLVWEWVNIKGGEICKQYRALGASCDWTREVFTMDATRTKAVNEAFIRMFNNGLIFRKYRLVNWCPALQSAISDIEVDYKEVKPNDMRKVPGYKDPIRFGYFTVFSYVVEGASNDTDSAKERIFVATTRLETMLGDTAVAVNPQDPVYKHFVGKKLIHPLRGDLIPVVADDYVDLNYGTGAVKITPAHDQNDWEVGLRHKLPAINILTDDGKINGVVKEFEGMARYEAREAVKEALIKCGSILKIPKMSEIPNASAVDEEGNPTSAFALLRKRMLQNGMIGPAAEAELAEAAAEAKEKEKAKEKGGDYSAVKKKKKFQAKGEKKGSSEEKPAIQLSPEKQAELDETSFGWDFGHAMGITVCSRTGDVIEPMLKYQWYVDCSENGLAKHCKSAMRSFTTPPPEHPSDPYEGMIAVTPPSHKTIWDNWFNGMRDWCISRQLWWGHRIPAYRAFLKTSDGSIPAEDDSSKWFVGHTEEDALKAAAKFFNVPEEKVCLVQDEDVLDTWYSSGLFPFSILGWPDETNSDFQQLFPTSLLETGEDIIFFWVARMVMMSINLTGKVPFTEVYLHTMIRDKNGRKMSKSLGNIIDPRDVIYGRTKAELLERADKASVSDAEKKVSKEAIEREYPRGIERHGVDSLRLGLATYLRQDSSINLNLDVVKAQHAFCNKIWNMTKFVLMYLPQGFKPVQKEIEWSADCFVGKASGASSSTTPSPVQQPHELNALISSPTDRWMLSRVYHTVHKVINYFNQLKLGDIVNTVRSLILDDFCDRYLESVKPILQSESSTSASSSSEPSEAKEEKEKKEGALSEADQVRQVLYEVLDVSLRLLHPFIPFVTEELWQHIPRREGDKSSISVSSFPLDTQYECFCHSAPESTLKYNAAVLNSCTATVFQATNAIRSLRDTFKVKPSYKCEAFIGFTDASSISAEHAAMFEQIEKGIISSDAAGDRGCASLASPSPSPSPAQSPSSSASASSSQPSSHSNLIPPNVLIQCCPQLLQCVASRFLTKLAGAKSVALLPAANERPGCGDECVVSFIPGATIFMRLRRGSASVDYAAEAKKQLAQAEKTKKDIDKLEKQLGNKGKIPADKVADMEKKIITKKAEIASMESLAGQFAKLAEAQSLEGEEGEADSDEEGEAKEEETEEKKKMREEKRRKIEEKKKQKAIEKKEREEREKKEKEEKERLKQEKKAAKEKLAKEKKAKKEAEKAEKAEKETAEAGKEAEEKPKDQ
ncbi:putative valyl-tRNA synthetase [Monocercomonoides exilis]|uniref:putative valyl-tRNA synthetase n=1 Tax=Monocercomonoides exilis TaxID=2049356 RepID=UPI0035597857|nr:putative valyl-tRNA synthetase [Monocercomonoides exilis]|eukprot:MONOS_7278.1-p1 / transcript=MONOS_7278.1 / gene=MONOS_7278 / organism=Monocercomonoides_exilis_PA203 / gene_product=valyl-tRNA synthetase / transcript_product=valyl-tRNA synthetase / location=Mono_scaffold00246:2259-6359(+) / protein_length=1367 / sequence_SO=supercontig / SO=protein_coding / is_pseudo=false